MAKKKPIACRFMAGSEAQDEVAGSPTLSDGADCDAYCRYPTCSGGRVVFVADDDLWEVPLEGGLARRLTTSLAEASHPALSPDGRLLAFVGQDDHEPEVYVMSARGGSPKRLTYLGGGAIVVGWTPDARIVFTSSASEPLEAHTWAYAQPPDGSPPERLPFGPITHLSFGRDGAIAISRNGRDPARWKRYRGGTAGQIWLKRNEAERFRRILEELDSNLAWPHLVGGRLYFVSDHEGVGNLYSVDLDGGDLRRHTDHDTYYLRWPKTDGSIFVYQHAAEIWAFDPEQDRYWKIPIEVASPRPQRTRRFVPPQQYLTEVAIHPKGHSVAVVTRGKLYSMPLFERAVRQHGQPQGVRYREVSWLGEGGELLAVSDEGGEDHLEIFPSSGGPGRRLDIEGLQGIEEVVSSPDGSRAALTTLAGELGVVDLGSGSWRLLDLSEFGQIEDVTWSPDGAWLAYSFAPSRRLRTIRLCRLSDGEVISATEAEFVDFAPAWDPEGRFLAFLSLRNFDPVPDEVYFDLSFPQATVVGMVLLTSGILPPFMPEPKGMGEAGSASREREGTLGAEDQAREEGEDPKEIRVELDGISRRVVVLDIPPGRYRQLEVLSDKLLLLNEPIHPSFSSPLSDEEREGGSLESYEIEDLHHEVLVGEGVRALEVSRDLSTMLVWVNDRLRAIGAGQKPPESDSDAPGRKSGWVDLDRIKVSVDPPSEWSQMLVEAWRLQRDHFWVPDMSGVDWAGVLERYRPLVARVSTRSEFSDLMWELQGELGTSHAYEWGGDHRPPPPWKLGRLGADFAFDRAVGRWRIARIVRGDTWHMQRGSSLAAGWLDVGEGDLVLAVGGVEVTPTRSPASLLVNMADQDVELTVARPDGTGVRQVVVRAVADDRQARYEEWVAQRRTQVRALSDGKVGYVHVPDMGVAGFAAFHRSYLAEAERDALVVDVRHNRGGSVSGLLLSKLALRRIGWDVSRWAKPAPYPADAPGGPLVALVDEWAGSDGDIFAHAFKLLKLGPVVGTRTWGGVIGIEPSRRLVDGSLTTQPEFSFWFEDVGFDIENRGVEPTHEVVVTPEDWAEGRDPQLERAVELALEALRSAPARTPDLSRRRLLPLPSLPPRKPVQG